MGFPLYTTYCFSLVTFNILSLWLVFVSLISMSWHVSPWDYPVWDTLCLLDVIDYFLFHVGEIFHYNFFKNFLIPPFFSSLLLWDPYNLKVGAFDIFPDVCLLSLKKNNSDGYGWVRWQSWSADDLVCIFALFVVSMRCPAQGATDDWWCQVLYSSGFLCVSSHYLILPMVISLVV